VSEHREETDEETTGKASAYEEPIVDDLETVDGPAVTAAAASPT
jgi:hypothetical protein